MSGTETVANAVLRVTRCAGSMARLPSASIVALALSAHGTGEGAAWNGFLLGYAQVPAENMDGLARRLGALLPA